MMRVIKLGGRAQADPALAAAIGHAWRAAPGALCLVHGGGDEVSALQRRLGVQPIFIGGRRVTSEGDLELLRMALSGLVNKRLVAVLVAHGLPAVGISGEDAALITARPLDAGLLGVAGIPERVDVTLVRDLLAAGYLPVVSPVSARAERAQGDCLNVNGDDAAAALAAALAAEELLLVADVPGVLAGGQTIEVLDADRALGMITAGSAGGGMAAKLQSALGALERGVASVRIGDLAMLVDGGRGTLVVSHARSAA